MEINHIWEVKLEIRVKKENYVRVAILTFQLNLHCKSVLINELDHLRRFEELSHTRMLSSFLGFRFCSLGGIKTVSISCKIPLLLSRLLNTTLALLLRYIASWKQETSLIPVILPSRIFSLLIKYILYLRVCDGEDITHKRREVPRLRKVLW